MNKIIIAVIIIVIIGIGGYFLYKGIYKSPAPSAGLPPAQVNQQPDQTQSSANEVQIKNFSFNPDILTVKQGTKVTWTNQDSATHKIKSDTFNSSNLNQGDKFEFTFNDLGSFDYSCSIHPSMKGKVVVEQ